MTPLLLLTLPPFHAAPALFAAGLVVGLACIAYGLALRRGRK